MQLENKFSWDDPKTIKHIFYAGAVYFILNTLYSLINYEEKFLLDGTSIVFYIANSEWFPGAVQREVMFLGQFIPVGLAKSGFELKWILLGYVANVSLFYFSLFIVTILILKDSLSSIFLILVHFRGDPYNYFFMVEELLPGVCILIVLVSLILNFRNINRPWVGYVFIILLTMLVVRSHPITLVCLGGAGVILLLSFPDIITKNKKVIAVTMATAIVFVAIKLLTLNAYDNNMMFKTPKTIFESALQLINPNYAWNMVMYLFYSRMIFTLIFCITIIFLLVEQRYLSLVVILGLIFGLTALFNTQIGSEGIRLESTNTSYDRWSLPVRFVVFMAFCFLVLRAIKAPLVYKGAFLSSIFYFSIGGLGIMEEQRKSNIYVNQAKDIIRHCREKGIDKALVRLEELDKSVMLYYNSYIDIILFSSLESPDSTIQVIYVNDEEIPYFEQLNDDLVVLNKNEIPREYDYLNENYFRLDKGRYTLINLTK